MKLYLKKYEPTYATLSGETWLRVRTEWGLNSWKFIPGFEFKNFRFILVIQNTFFLQDPDCLVLPYSHDGTLFWFLNWDLNASSFEEEDWTFDLTQIKCKNFTK